MARILFDVHLNSSVSRLSDNDLTYCSTERGAPINAKRVQHYFCTDNRSRE